jgi:hypothetical protein
MRPALVPPVEISPFLKACGLRVLVCEAIGIWVPSYAGFAGYRESGGQVSESHPHSLYEKLRISEEMTEIFHIYYLYITVGQSPEEWHDPYCT